MKNGKRLILIALAVLMLVCAASCGKKQDSRNPKNSAEKSDGPMLWHGTGSDGKEIWFFGTIHVGDKRNDAVLQRLKPVLEECDALAVEFDIVAYQSDYAAQAKDVMVFMLRDGTTVKDHLPEDVYDGLVAALKAEGAYMAQYDYFKPALWEQLLTETLVEKSGLKTDYAMDLLLINAAYDAGKEVLSVESAEFQYGLLANASDEYYAITIRQALDSAVLYPLALKELYEVWLKGDDSLYEMLVEEESGESAQLTEEERKTVDDFNAALTTQRNIGMAEKALEYMNSGKTVLFAVGAMHFLGDDGIIALLEKEGFTFERVEY